MNSDVKTIERRAVPRRFVIEHVDLVPNCDEEMGQVGANETAAAGNLRFSIKSDSWLCRNARFQRAIRRDQRRRARNLSG